MQPTQRLFVLFALGLAACAGKDPSDEGTSPTTSPSNPGNPDAGVLDSGLSTSPTVPMTTADSGAAGASCPAARPAEGSACQASAALCSYDEIECRCAAGTWDCEEPVHPGCPATTPTTGSSCSLPEATECDYLSQECECLSGVWMCQSEDEDAAVPVPDGGASDGGALVGDAGSDAGGACPEARPAELTTCVVASSQTCTYESTQCNCNNGLWSCSEPVDMGCPATTPLHGDPCSGIADCDFLEVECECLSSRWSCKPND